MKARLAIFLLVALTAACPGRSRGDGPDQTPAISADLRQALSAAGADLGNPVFIRVFKRPQAEFTQNPWVGDSSDPHPSAMPKDDMYSYTHAGLGDDQWEEKNGVVTKYSRNVGQMEIWIRRSGSGQYVLLKTYRVAAYSGPLGPKVKQGDLQTPEGFYTITPEQMKPDSNYVRAMDIGYPNTYDRSHAAPGVKLGGEVEIHGKEVTAGCLAMGDNIGDIYALVAAAQKSDGQKSVPVEIFPFPLTDANLAQIPDSKLKDFWETLKPAYAAFGSTHLPPTISYDAQGNYVVSGNLPERPDSRMLDPAAAACPGN